MKAVSNLKGRNYEDRLRELNLETLEERRKRGDLIQAYRVLSGKADVDPNIWFTLYQPAEDTCRQVVTSKLYHSNGKEKLGRTSGP